MSWLRRLAIAAVMVVAVGCSSVSTVRVQGTNVHVPAGYRPVAVVHAQATSAYVFFIGIPGGVSLDRVVNEMLIVTAKAMGADKVIDIEVEITPDDGIWALRRLVGWRSARASGLAIQLDPAAQTTPPPPPGPAGPPGATP